MYENELSKIEKLLEEKKLKEQAVLQAREDIVRTIDQNFGIKKMIMDAALEVGTGLNGKDGKDGRNGIDGINGIDGKDGLNGARGKDGLQGKPGKDGLNGKDGVNGKDGNDGKDGVGIESIKKVDNDLIVTLTTGEVRNIGSLPKTSNGGKYARSPYEYAQESGFTGTEDEFYILLANIGSSSGGGTWGSITGTMSEQTDLQEALNAKEPTITKATAFNKNFGTAQDDVCEGNDERLSDSRTPTAHTHDADEVNVSGQAFLDTNGNELLQFPTAIENAMNHIRASNSKTGQPVLIEAVGDDSDININLISKGLGVVQANGIDLVTITGAQTLYEKRIFLRIYSIASTSSIALDAALYDGATITALATNLAVNNTQMSAFNGQEFTLRIKDNGTARTLSWGSYYRSLSTKALPTATVPGTTYHFTFRWNGTDSRWDWIESTEQSFLVSGTNIKTVNNESLLGSGNLVITGTTLRRNQSTAAQVLTASTRTYLTGSNLTFPANSFVSGTRFRWVFDVTKTAAGTAASTVDICLGTAGTTADTARVSFAKKAGTAAVDAGMFTIEAVVRSTGASCVIAGAMQMTHNLASTGLATTASVNVTTISSSFDVSTATNIGVCMTTGASDAYTIQLVTAEAFNL